MLSKDITSIINKYLDYSSKNLISKFSSRRKEYKLVLKKDILIEDILFRCSINGYGGFFIYEKFEDLCKQIAKLPKPLYIKITNHENIYYGFENILPKIDIYIVIY